MFDYEMHKAHEAELLRRADHERLVGQARRAGRRRAAAGRQRAGGAA